MTLRKTVLLLLILLLCIMLGGCTPLDRLRGFKQELDSDDSTQTIMEAPLRTDADGSAEDADNAASADDPIAAALRDSVSATADGSAENAADDATELTQDSTRVLLYYVTADGSSLQAEERDIAKAEGLARATVEQLLLGPQQDDLSAALPAEVTLRDINIRDGLCTVDIGGDLSSLSDTKSQLLALYSIVDTVGQFDSVDRVRILLNGRSVDAPFGGVDASAALAPLYSF